MFREQLHKDLDGISPDEELLTKVTKLMQEEAQMPRPKMYRSVIRYCGMAAAVCMIAVGAIALNNSNIKTSENAARGTDMVYFSDEAVGGAATECAPAADMAEAAEEKPVAEEFALAAEDGVMAMEDSSKTSESGNSMETSDIQKKGILLSEIRYKGSTVEADADMSGKLIQRAIDYTKDNPDTVLGMALPKEMMEAVGDEGLYIHIIDSGRREAYILISDNDSLVCCKNTFYSVSDEFKAEILAYFE
ncbi:MAG: hypothetical protein IJX15_01855 [Ruminiclostridium sp.]|nr:hypothetical protein [Ruminiclostridium sp.]MBQ8841883.1 hypothetical protein [Ruminiclostridium sp.]